MMTGKKFIGKTLEEIEAMGYKVDRGICENLVMESDGWYYCSVFLDDDGVVKCTGVNLLYV